MRRILFGTWLLATSACHHDPPAPHEEEAAAAVLASSSPPPPPSPPPIACLPRKTKHGPLSHVEAIADKVRVCYGEREGERGADAEATDVACVDVDVTGGSVTAAPRWSLPASVIPPSDAVSSDGSRSFAFTIADASATVFGDTTDTKTHKRLFHVTLSRGTSFTNPKNVWSAHWFGSGVVITEKLCCDPEGTTLLLDPEHGTTKRLHGFAGTHGAIDESTLFSIDGRKLTFVDIATQHTIAGPFTAPGATFPDPELLNADAVVVGNVLVFAYANPPGYLTIDVSTKTARPGVALPLCATAD